MLLSCVVDLLIEFFVVFGSIDGPEHADGLGELRRYGLKKLLTYFKMISSQKILVIDFETIL